MNTPTKTIAAALLPLLLAACGGGGDDGGNSGFTPPTDAYDARAAWQNLLTQQRTWSGITGRGSDNLTYTVSVQVGPLADAAFPLSGTVLRRGSQTVTTQVGNATPTVVLNELFYDAGLLWQGSRHTVGNGTPSCDEATTGTSALPPTAVRFDAAGTPVTGALLAGTIYANCSSRTGVRGTAASSWSLEFESGIVWFCVTTRAEDLLQPPTVTTESDCVSVSSPAGTLGDRARITLRQSVGGSDIFLLVARN